jgi:PEP-CTERM motif
MRTVLKKKLIGVVFLLGVVPAWGGLTPCGAPQLLNTTVVGTNQGCTYLNAAFDNFSVSGATGANISFPVNTGTNMNSNIEFGASGTSTYTLDFQTVASNVIGSATDPLPCAANTWCVLEATANKVASQSFTYGAVATNGAEFFGLSLTDGTLQPHSINVPDIITTMEAFCLGISTFTCSTSGGTYGYIEVVESENTAFGTSGDGFNATYMVCVPGVGGCVLQSNPNSASISFVGITSVGIQDTVSISIVGGVEPVFIDSFDNSFQGAPEPSTLILMGGALAGLGLVGVRRRSSEVASVTSVCENVGADRSRWSRL